jgi:hypothetical protein
MSLIDEAGVKALSTWLAKEPVVVKTVRIHNGPDLDVRDGSELATLKQILYRNDVKFIVI